MDRDERAGTTSPEDLICLQASIDELRRERESLSKRLQTAESGAREKVQLSESRLREALSQIDGLKRTTQAMRVRLEAETKRAEQAQEALTRRHAATEALHTANVELTTALDAAQTRLADLETESGIHEGEIDRLQAEHTEASARIEMLTTQLDGVQQTMAERTLVAEAAAAQQVALTHTLAALEEQQRALHDSLSALQADRDRVQAALDGSEQERSRASEAQRTIAQREAQLVANLAVAQQRETGLHGTIENLRRQHADDRTAAAAQIESVAQQLATAQQRHADSEQQIEAIHIAHAEELTLWQDTATQREAELVTARDDLARRLEEIESQTILAREEATALAGRLHDVDAHLATETTQRIALEEELAAAHEDHARERTVFETAARQREEEHRHALESVRATLDERTKALAAERDAALQRARETDELLEVASTEHRTLSDRSAALEAELHVGNQRIDELVAAAEQFRQQHLADMQAVTGDARTAREALQGDLDSARSDAQSAQATAAETAARVRTLEEQLASREAQGGELSAQLAALVATASERDARLAQLRADAEAARQQHAQELQALADHAQAREAEWDVARGGLHCELDAARSDLTTSRETTEAAHARLSALEAQLAAGSAESATLSAQVATLEITIEQRDGELTQLRSDDQQAREQLSAELDATRAELSKRTVSLDAIRMQVRALEAQLAERDTTRKALSDRIAQLETELGERDARVQKLTTEVEALRREYSGELDEWQATAAQREAELVAARDALASQLAEEQSRAAHLHDQAAAAGERIREVETTLQAAQQETQQRDAEWRDTHAAHAAAQAAVQLDVEAARSDAAGQREALVAAQGRIESLEESLAGRDADARDVQARLKQELAVAGNEILGRHDALAAAETRIHSLEASLAGRDAEGGALAGRLANLDAELQTRAARLEELTDAAATLRQQHAGEIETWEQAAAQREAELVAARDTLADRLADETAQAAAAREQTSALSLQVHELEGTIVGLRAGGVEIEQQEAAWRAAEAALRQEIEATRAQLASGQAALDAAREEAQLLTERVTAREHEMNVLQTQLASAPVVSAVSPEQLAAAEERERALQERCDELTGHLEEVQDQTVGALQAQESMGLRIEELDTEQREMHVRTDQLTALNGQLERECEKLRRERTTGDDTRKQKADNTRLEAKIAEIERQHAEAAQRHSAAVAGYMVELNQRAETLHGRTIELQKANEELNLTRQACDDAVAQLALVRQEHADIEQQMLELRAVASAAAARPKPEERMPPQPARPGVPAKPAEPAAKPAMLDPAAPGASKPAAPPLPRTIKAGAPLTLVHLEENKAFRDHVREILSPLPEAHYLNTLDGPPGNGLQMLAVNLLNRAHDPLAAIASTVAADAEHAEVFAYCADGACGFAFGKVDFFAAPIDPDGCVTRLLERRGSVQRLLAVSDNVEMTGALREVLGRVRCSTSVAFDVRQAVDLLPMIKPDVVLVDFSLPRGEGLRLVSRLRSDPKTRDIALAVLLPTPGNVAEFRQHALRAAREFPLSPAQLAQALAHRLGIPTPAAGGEAKGAKMLQTG